MTIVGQGTSDGKTILACNRRVLIIQLLGFPLNWTNTAYLLFQFFLCMAIRLVDWFCRFAQIMKVTQLMRNLWKGGRHCIANGMLAIRNDPPNGNSERILHFLEQGHDIGLRFAEQRPSKQNLA